MIDFVELCFLAACCEESQFKIGEAGIVIGAIDLPAIQEAPGGHALYLSIINYFATEEFHPQLEPDIYSNLGPGLIGWR